ncbi:MAG: diguanylate cyclase [Gammaproteobacteria bacterium]|nr:diguanylate cyclase [Gammaproteobacteria bacterium]
MVELHPEQARAVLADLAIGVVVLDGRECVMWANAHAERLLGAPVSALIGENARVLALPYALPTADSSEQPTVRVRGALVGFTQHYHHATGDGALVMLYERGHALVGFLNALASGVAGGISSIGVLNRAAIKSRLEGEISRSRRYSNPLSCITVHLAGDELLRDMGELARMLKEQLRWVDLLGQWRDDVLLVVLPETTEDAAARLTAKLMGLVAPPPGREQTLTIGCASWRRGDNAERMIRRALTCARQDAACPPASGAGGC